jgi:hypothetical protein
MLEFLRGKSSEEKLRRFKIACCRLIWHLITDDRLRKTVEAVEAFADGVLSRELLEVEKHAGSIASAEIATSRPTFRTHHTKQVAERAVCAVHAACCVAWDSLPEHNIDAYTYAGTTSAAAARAIGLSTSHSSKLVSDHYGQALGEWAIGHSTSHSSKSREKEREELTRHAEFDFCPFSGDGNPETVRTSCVLGWSFFTPAPLPGVAKSPDLCKCPGMSQTLP